MRLTRSVVPAAALLLLTATAGCGGDDEPASGSPAPGASTSQAGGGETDSPSGGLTDICPEITEAEVAAIVGAAVTVEEVPGGGCNFEQEDPRATSISFATNVEDPAAGGFDGAVTGLSGTFDDAQGAEVPGVGDRAYAATGTVFGGESQQGGGLVLVGSARIQVQVAQSTGLSAAKVKALVVAALELAASKG